jgi:chlorobactene glucosyltransferase
MMQYISIGLPQGIIYFQIIVLLIIFTNILILFQTNQRETKDNFPSVSVLIPARNEQMNIEECILSLLQQDYPNFEVIVLNDHSTDATKEIVRHIQQKHKNLQNLDGKSLPKGWLGKNWACHQLAQAANGEILFFTDADTIHSTDALRKIIGMVEGNHADFLTGFPRQLMLTWGERFIVPVFYWAFFSFSPFILAYWIKSPIFTRAIGQLMVFRRSAYEKLGGHAAVKASVVEDLELAREVCSLGMRWRIIDAAEMIQCRMYHGVGETVDGLAKNLFAVFDFRLLEYLFVWIWMAVITFLPFIMLIVNAFGFISLDARSILLFGLCIILSLTWWLLCCRQLRFPVWMAFIYPAMILMFEWVAFHSLWQTLTGRVKWKERAITRPKIRFL